MATATRELSRRAKKSKEQIAEERELAIGKDTRSAGFMLYLHDLLTDAEFEKVKRRWRKRWECGEGTEITLAGSSRKAKVQG